MPPSSSRSGRALAAIRRNLANGRFKAGDQLPAEQDLATHLGVSRGTLRSALKQLEDEGLLRAEPRRGRVVVGTQSATSGMMSSTVALLSWTPTDRRSRQQAGHGMIQTEFAVLDGLANESLHSMMLHPDRLAGVGLEQLLNDRPVGIVVSHQVADAAEGQSLIRRLAEAGIPLVFNGNHEGLRHVDRVSSDHVGGAAELVGRLLAQGRRRILRLWDAQPTYWLAGRNAGYERAMREAGLEPLPAAQVPGLHVRPGDPQPSFEARVTMFAGALVPYLTGSLPGGLPGAGERRIDAIMMNTDSAALAAAQACQRFGLRVHEDVAIVGYDDNWSTIPGRPGDVPPPLFTVDKQNVLVGREMLRVLLQRVRGQVPPQPQHVLVPGRVVEVDPASPNHQLRVD